VCVNKLIDSVEEEQRSRGKLSGPLMAVAIAVPVVVACECQQQQQQQQYSVFCAVRFCVKLLSSAAMSVAMLQYPWLPQVKGSGGTNAACAGLA
jgi:transcriptional regulator of aromatic amino acid metabolism